MTTPFRGPLYVNITKKQVVDYLSDRHHHLSLSDVIARFEGSSFVEDHLDAIAHVFKLGFYEGWNSSYEEWMCYYDDDPADEEEFRMSQEAQR